MSPPRSTETSRASTPLTPSRPKSAAERERRRLLAELQEKEKEEAKRERLTADARRRAESRRGALGGRRGSLLRQPNANRDTPNDLRPRKRLGA